ncbi:hypothetical protein D3C85_1781050 [compost metagenome]
MQAINVRMGVTTIQNPEPMLGAPQPFGAGKVTGQEYRQSQTQIAYQPLMQRIQFGQPFGGECSPRRV